ncbi:MAG: hypothetical protein RLZZ272_219 [Actinomycetota bacterium]|jgi:hypothetical protein
MPTRPSIAAALALGLSLGLAACGSGDATVRIDRAEGIVLDTVRAVAADLGLPTADIELVGREPCSTVSGEPGLRNRIVVRAGAPEGLDVGGVAAAALVREGFEVVESGVPGTVLGQREGMRVTAARASRGIELDGITGCRPPPR